MEKRYVIAPNSTDISKELHRLSMPFGYNEDVKMFDVLTHSDGRKAMVVDLDAEILIHPLKNTSKLQELISYTPEQITSLNEYLDFLLRDQPTEEPPSGFLLVRIPFRNLITGFTGVSDEEYMINDGWIEIEEE